MNAKVERAAPLAPRPARGRPFGLRTAMFAAFLCGAFAEIAPGAAAGAVLDAKENTQLSDNYRLGAGDELRITVFNEEDLSGKFSVSASGAVEMPLIGSVSAHGQTIAQFGDALSERLKTYVRAPKVAVEVATYRPFYILGEVSRPGTYPYAANLTVINAIATAGGFSNRANRGKIFIKHTDQTEELVSRLDPATPVSPGDTIRIPERLF